MDTIPILSGVIMVTTGVTIILAVGSYTLYRFRELRKRRREREAKKEQKPGPKYFERYYPGENSISEE